MITNIVFGVLGVGVAFSTAVAALTGTIKAKAKEIKDGINGLVESPTAGESWKTITDNISDGISAVVTAFADLTDPEKGIKFAEIGGAIGEGIATIASHVDFSTVVVAIGNGFLGMAIAFATGVSTITAGLPVKAQQIAEGINKLVAENGFKTVIDNVSTGVNNIIDGFAELVGLGPSGGKGIDFDGISKNVTDGINALITETHFETAVSAVLVGMGKITAAFLRGLAEIHWSTLASRLAQGVNDFINDPQIDWAKAGEDLGNAFKGAVMGIATFLTEADWEQLGSNIGTAFANIDWIGIGTTILNLLKAGVLAALRLSVGFIDAIGGEIEKKLIAGVAGVSNKILDNLSISLSLASITCLPDNVPVSIPLYLDK